MIEFVPLKRVTLLLVGLAHGLACGTTYFVAKTGNDHNPGTQASPWLHIQRACNGIKAGDTVLVETGTYYEEITVRAPMTLAAAPAAKPIIDGTTLPVADANAALVLIQDLSNVTLKGFEIRNLKTTNSNLVPCGVFVHGRCNNVQISNNLVDHIENDGADPGSINAFGIAVYGDSPLGPISNLLISGNEVRYTKTGSSETVTLNGNVVNFHVLNNRIHDVNNIGIDCIGFEGTSPIQGQDQARFGEVAGNTVFNISSAANPAYFGDRSANGIYVDGGLDIVIERNVVHNTDIGIEVASEHGGHFAAGVIVRNNLIYFSNVVGLSLGGFAASKGGTRACKFVNNTFYHNDTTLSGSGEVQIQYNTSLNLFDNNILDASGQGVLFSGVTGVGSTVGMTADYNLFFAAANASWAWNGRSFSTLAAYSAATRNDKHSSFANPDFASPAALNFRLLSASPAIARGFDLGAAVVGALDLDANPRLNGTLIDIGCYEFKAAP